MHNTNHMSYGEQGKAGELESKRTRCEVWTRVMGYHRPVSHFNIGKKAEHYSRRHFTEAAALANQEFCEQYGSQLAPVSVTSAQ